MKVQIRLLFPSTSKELAMALESYAQIFLVHFMLFISIPSLN